MHLDGNKLKGVDVSTGSLGHGLPMAVGLALGAEAQKKSWLTYCSLGDGECDEGTVWEAAMAASHFKVRNLITFEDHNIHGGPGSAVADVIASGGKGCAFTKVGIPDCYCKVGYPEDLYSHYKIDTDGIIEKVRETMGENFEEDEDREDEV